MHRLHRGPAVKAREGLPPKQRAQEARARALVLAEQLEPTNIIAEHPFQSIAAAAAAGFVVGYSPKAAHTLAGAAKSVAATWSDIFPGD